jgi:hypothetical protein
MGDLWASTIVSPILVLGLFYGGPYHQVVVCNIGLFLVRVNRYFLQSFNRFGNLGLRKKFV